MISRLVRPVGGPSDDIVDRRLVIAHADDDDAMERRIRVSVTAPIETVSTGGHAGRGGDRTGAAELRKGGFRANPLGIIPEDNQHRSRGVGADSESLPEGGRCLGGQSGEVPVMRRNFVGEGQPPTGERPERVLAGRHGRVERTRSKPRAARDKGAIREGLQGLSQHWRRVDDDLFKCDHRGGAGFDRGISGHAVEKASHCDDVVMGTILLLSLGESAVPQTDATGGHEARS